MNTAVRSVVALLLAYCLQFNAQSVKVETSVKKMKLIRYMDEAKPGHWRRDAVATLQSKLARKPNTNRAKNVIFFMGDGMSLSTLAATRVYEGKKIGLLGEEYKLSFEQFPYTGLSKTYCLDRQVADSACSATAYLCGVKTNFATIGLSGSARRGDCASQKDQRNQIDSIVAWSQWAGKRTGVVTTTRVTHASPAGAYAHAADRGWESDTDAKASGGCKCPDIAMQLVNGPVGAKLNVIMGGGRKNFYPKEQLDPEGIAGYRSDGANLTSDWLMSKANRSAAYVFDKSGLMDVRIEKLDYLMGLFSSDHMNYYSESDRVKDPTLTEMTVKAIQLLERDDPNGYFLFVEGGKIDMAHHETKARKALEETSQLSEAVEAAINLVDLNNTLVVVTSDHSHTMTYSGYNRRGADILGLSQMQASDGLLYTTLSYANGPGYRTLDLRTNKRHDVLNDDTESGNYMYSSTVPLVSETHSGEDVAVFANGPWSHLFTGTWEQSYIPHAVAYAACIGQGPTACHPQL